MSPTVTNGNGEWGKQGDRDLADVSGGGIKLWNRIHSAKEMNVKSLKLSVLEWSLSHLGEGRGSDTYPMISQPTDGGKIVKQQLKSQLILVNFYFVLPQYHIKRACFP